MFFRQLFSWGNNTRKRGTEQLEAEVKILGVTEGEMQSALAHAGARKTFEGKVVTTWFKKSLLERVNTRVRMTVDSEGKKKFLWTIKTNPENDEPGALLKNKLKRQEEASSFSAAKKALAEELTHLGVIVTPEFLTSKLTVEKMRSSYVCETGACAGLRFDFDTITAVDGEPLEAPLTILEIEDVSDQKAKEKEEKILACAKSLGLSIDAEFSSLSTRKLLNTLGYRQ